MLGAKGLKGGLRVEILTDWPERLEPDAEVWPEGDAVARRDPARRVRRPGPGDPPRRDRQPRGGRGARPGATSRFRPARCDDGAYYWDDLIGLRVESPDGEPVGELVEVFRAGGNEVYRIVGPAGERLVPALRSAVQRIDLEAGVMVVAPDDAEEVR